MLLYREIERWGRSSYLMIQGLVWSGSSCTGCWCLSLARCLLSSHAADFRHQRANCSLYQSHATAKSHSLNNSIHPLSYNNCDRSVKLPPD